MDSAQDDETSRFKLAQLWNIVDRTHEKLRTVNVHKRIVNELLENDFNIDQKVTIRPRRGSKIHLTDCTALHFLYYEVLDIDTFTTLVERGADFTVKNGNGQTVLHLIVTKSDMHAFGTEKGLPFMNSVLSAHVKSQNSINPRDDNGISHLHAACIANHVEAVELFLNNEALVNEAVNLDAPEYAGYTPLHFAAEFHNFQVVQILVSRGADVCAQTAEGTSPLDLVLNKSVDRLSQVEITEREQVIKLLLEKNEGSGNNFSRLRAACTLKDLTIAEGLLDQDVDIDHAAPIAMNSFNRGGNSALHFAADNSLEAVKMLLTRGAKIDVASDDGRTPLDLCIDKYGFQSVCNVLSSNDIWKEIRLSDGETKLLDLIAAMSDLERFKVFLDNEIKDTGAVVSSDSVLWPGYTILHLAVAFSKQIREDLKPLERRHDKTIVEECLYRGLPVNAQDVKGQTAIHLASRQHKHEIAALMLEHLDRPHQLADVVDEDNFSYLHVACMINNKPVLERLLETSDPNIAWKGKELSAGSTPLHLAAAYGFHAIANTLLRHGADLHATDQHGMTPIHRLPFFLNWPQRRRIVDVLLNALLKNLEDRVVPGLGLSYLHIACICGNVEVIEKLLDLGSDVNAAIKCDGSTSKRVLWNFGPYWNFTPLQMAMEGRKIDETVLDVLLRRGADVFAKGSNGLTKHFDIRRIPIEDHRVRRHFFLQVLRGREDMRKSMEERFGLTKLHIACYTKNEEAVKSALNDEIDVNAQTHADAEIFAGCTPLHMLTSAADPEDDWIEFPSATFTIGGIINLLVDRGADVTVANSEGDTPVHVFGKHRSSFLDAQTCQGLLLNAQQNYRVDPVNAEGCSHFHLACFWHRPEVVDRFLQHGSVDVDRPIDCFAKHYAGCTPLHLALRHEMTEPDNDWTKLSQVVDLLLKHGADIAAKDVHGDTPLHQPAVLCSPEMSLLEMLVSRGGDIKTENIQGQTPVEKLTDMYGVNSGYSNCVKFFEKYSLKIDSWNRLTGEGYIAKIFLSNRGDPSASPELQKFAKSPDATKIDSLGRTAIHNSVAISENQFAPGRVQDYICAIGSFLKIGVDLEHRDESGQTALHYAVLMENATGVQALLACGADVNIVDNTGKSAFSYALEHSERKYDLHICLPIENVTKVLRLHILKLQYLGIEVSQLNQDLVQGIQHFFDQPYYPLYTKELVNPSKKFFSQAELTKTMNVGTNSLTLFDCLSKSGVAELYSCMQQSERELVDAFFKSIDFNELDELIGIIKLQFRKMNTPLGWFDWTFSSLKTLIGF